MSFNDKKVLITGGSRGIGKAIADMFVDVGANVTITCTGSKSGLQSEDRSVLYVDFTDDGSTSEFLDKVVKDGDYDIVINNAGINIIKPFEEVYDAAFDKVMKVNLYAPFKVAQAASYAMIRKGWGRIVNIASIWSIVTKAGRTSYTASKAGLVGMTKTMAIELAPHGVLMNSVSPGFTMTDLTRESLTDEQMTEMSAQVPMGRFADPDEIARLVMFLCSDVNTYMVGQNVVIDGGFTIV